MRTSHILLFFVLFIIPISIFGQEKLLSDAELYYDFEALIGNTESQSLNFRTLSDSKWNFSDSINSIWQNAKMETKISNSFKIYAPELFVSYNSASPYGQNDGILWQGKGTNTYFSTGIRFEKYGFEITLKPEFAFSSNHQYDYVKPNFVGSLYENKAADFGYFGVGKPDAPQRFGNKSYTQIGWGDSEIRYSYRRWTLGIGTQYIWLGPAKINPIMHSNNAPSYPKVDVGLRKASINLWGWYAGDIEARMWIGKLQESDFFDNDPINNKFIISGLAVGIAPSFLKGLTLFANRTFLAQWEKKSFKSLYELINLPLNTNGARDNWDQRASLGFDYLLPKAGVEFYTEIGLNDHSPGIDGYIRYPFHSMAYTAGFRKFIPIGKQNNKMRGELLVEVTNLEMSQDFQFQWASTFYAHHEIKQGYTNRGQWLGAGNGTGGNSQFVGFTIYHPKGKINTFVHRQNPDNDYIYQFSIGKPIPTPENEIDYGTIIIRDIKAVLSAGVGSTYFITPKIHLTSGLSYIVEHNPFYKSISWTETNKRRSINLQTKISYHF